MAESFGEEKKSFARCGSLEIAGTAGKLGFLRFFHGAELLHLCSSWAGVSGVPGPGMLEAQRLSSCQ